MFASDDHAGSWSQMRMCIPASKLCSAAMLPTVLPVAVLPVHDTHRGCVRCARGATAAARLHEVPAGMRSPSSSRVMDVTRSFMIWFHSALFTQQLQQHRNTRMNKDARHAVSRGCWAEAGGRRRRRGGSLHDQKNYLSFEDVGHWQLHILLNSSRPHERITMVACWLAQHQIASVRTIGG